MHAGVDAWEAHTFVWPSPGTSCSVPSMPPSMVILHLDRQEAMDGPAQGAMSLEWVAALSSRVLTKFVARLPVSCLSDLVRFLVALRCCVPPEEGAEAARVRAVGASYIDVR